MERSGPKRLLRHWSFYRATIGWVLSRVWKYHGNEFKLGKSNTARQIENLQLIEEVCSPWRIELRNFTNLCSEYIPSTNVHNTFDIRSGKQNNKMLNSIWHTIADCRPALLSCLQFAETTASVKMKFVTQKKENTKKHIMYLKSAQRPSKI